MNLSMKYENVNGCQPIPLQMLSWAPGTTTITTSMATRREARRKRRSNEKLCSEQTRLLSPILIGGAMRLVSAKKLT